MKIAVAPAILACLTLVSACSTPLENCISNAQSNYNATYRAIQVAQENVARGYAINRQRVPYQTTGICYNYTIGNYSCMQTDYRTEETPVSIDVNEERQKIKEYSAALPSLQRQAGAATAQCQQTYPAK